MVLGEKKKTDIVYGQNFLSRSLRATQKIGPVKQITGTDKIFHCEQSLQRRLEQQRGHARGQEPWIDDLSDCLPARLYIDFLGLSTGNGEETPSDFWL